MQDDSALGRWYRTNLGVPPEPDHVSAYWTFLLGAGAALAALLFYLLSTTYAVDSDPSFLYRQIAFTLALVAGPVVGLSVVYFLPLQERAVTLALAGLGVCALSIAGFNVVYPSDWDGGLDYSAPIVTVYAGGVALQLLTIFLYPLLTDETAASAAASDAEQTESRATFQLYEDRGGEWRWRLRHDDGTVVADSGDGYRSREGARQDVESVRVNAAGADEAVLESPPAGAERDDGFEPATVTDATPTGDASDAAAAGGAEASASAADSATADETTTGDERSEPGAATDASADESTDASAGGTAGDGAVTINGVTDDVAGDDAETIDAATDDAATDDPATEDELPDSGRFELYKDGDEEWRWRLRHRDGNVVADSAQGHRARSAIEDAIERVQSIAPESDALEYDPAAFELYRDESGGWRWRLRHRNGKLLADAGEGYASRGNARKGIEAVRNRAADADDFEVYQDAGGEYRWRLRGGNGEVVADGAEGYGLEASARDAAERVREYVPVADTLEYDPAGFEVYQDGAGEWRWRLRHRNGRILADSGEGYTVKAKARQGMRSVVNNAADAAVVERAD